MNRKKIIKIILSCFLSVFFITICINIYMMYSTKDRIMVIDRINEINDVDAIIILGCKVEEYGPSLMLTRRLDKGIEVYDKLHTKIILTGDHRDDYDEVDVMKEYVLSSDVNSKDILLDYEGFSTYDSIYRVKNVYKAKKVVIITQKYHMYRALYLAKSLDLEAYGVVADDIPQKAIMFKNELREILSRDKNFFKGIFKPKSDYLEEIKAYSE